MQYFLTVIQFHTSAAFLIYTNAIGQRNTCVQGGHIDASFDFSGAHDLLQTPTPTSTTMQMKIYFIHTETRNQFYLFIFPFYTIKLGIFMYSVYSKNFFVDRTGAPLTHTNRHTHKHTTHKQTNKHTYTPPQTNKYIKMQYQHTQIHKIVLWQKSSFMAKQQMEKHVYCWMCRSLYNLCINQLIPFRWVWRCKSFWRKVKHGRRSDTIWRVYFIIQI